MTISCRLRLAILRAPIIFSFLWILIICSTIARGQGSDYGSTPLALSPGSPAGSYPLSDIDTVNLFNGHVNIQIPLLAEGGRGGAKSAAYFNWNSPAQWHVRSEVNPNDPPWPMYYAEQTGGFATGLTNGINLGAFTVYGIQSGSGEHYCDPGGFKYGGTLTRLYFVEPNGTEHEMRDTATDGSPFQAGYCPNNGGSRGKIFVSSDGSGATFIADEVVRDDVYAGNGYPYIGPAGYLMLKNGSRYRIDASSSSLRDPNGNLLSWAMVGDGENHQWQVTDALNRQVIRQPLFSSQQCTALGNGASDSCEKITYKGFGGAQRAIWLSYDSTYLTPLQLFLPNGLSYHFYYNDYGDLTRIDLPTGGSIEYDYGPGLAGSQPSYPIVQGAIPGTYCGDSYNCDSYYIYRRLVERRVYNAGHVLESRQTFSKPETFQSNDAGNPIDAGYVEKKQYDGNLSDPKLLGSERHYFYGAASPSFHKNSSWKDGREYHTEIYDQNGNLQRQSDQAWEQRAHVAWWLAGGGNVDTEPQRDPRISATSLHLENGLTTTTTNSYDPTVPYNSLTDVYEYDYGGSAPARHTQTTYLKNLNGVDYTGSNITDPSAPYLRDFPLQSSVFDAGGVERARTTFEYDNYASDTNHAGIIDRSGISGHDSAFATSYSKRGNVTATTTYLLDNGSVTGSVTAYAQYDIAGNPVKMIDARGNATTLSYADSFGSPDADARQNSAPIELSSVSQTSYAFPTSVTNAKGHTSFSQFDYYLGRPVNIEDANGIVSNGSYLDSLDRPTQMVKAVGTSSATQTSFGYDDQNHVITTSRDLNSYGDNLLINKTIYDSLGRTVETEQFEGSGHYIAVQTLYDALGRAYKMSSPFRPWQGEVAIWTTTTFDALGRITAVKTPDNAVVTSAFAGNAVTVTDQANKSRRSITDAFGRLTRVDEPDAGNNLGSIGAPTQPTSYSYDVLNNLIAVNQGTQARYFMYDSFKRLIRARNPEQDINGALNVSDPQTGNSQWSSGYDYDGNGNLTHKTDARGIVSTYVYDVLNRNINISYANDASGTPTVSRYYDGWRDGVNQNVPYSVGRLWQMETSGSNGSRTTINGFDVLGRPTSQSLEFYSGGAWGQAYTITPSYNRANAMVSEIYPSNRTVNYEYDEAGRATGVSGNLGDGLSRTYSTAILYSSLGGMVKEQFGTDTPIYNKLFYNSRGQMAEIRVSTTTYSGPTDTSWNRGAIINHYSNNCWGMCGGSNSTTAMTDNNGNLQKQEVYIPYDDQISGYTNWWQQYNYDSLNRLSWAREISSGGTELWKQAYDYDRYGNRTINQAGTYGTGINKKDFTVNTANNRLGVPGGQSGTMSFDSAGNLTVDTYSAAAVSRTYDAENHMISETQANNSVAGNYTYSGDGQRVKRNVGGVETRQVYGLSGELLAEYPAGAAPGSPQKEYGYRNGQLLITAAVTSGWGPTPILHDSPLVINETIVQARHITELRDAINALRAHMNLSAYSWQYSATTNDFINVNPILEMRTALDQALGAPSPAYAIGLAQGQPVKAIHIQELRDRVLGAWNTSTGGTDIQWLVADQLGTPRMIFDKTGSLANTKRHDYLPFGEELYAGQGARTTIMGYGLTDGVRQKFTKYERDIETGLDYARARYYANAQGRFTSSDPFMGSGRTASPQSWNRYAYCANNPLVLTDPSGLDWGFFDFGDGTASIVWFQGKVGKHNGHQYTPINFGKSSSMIVTLTDGSHVQIFKNGGSNPIGPNTHTAPETQHQQQDRLPAANQALINQVAGQPFEKATAIFAAASLNGYTVAASGSAILLFDSAAMVGIILHDAAEQDNESASNVALTARHVDGGQISEKNFPDAAMRYLGPGYKEVSPGRYLSADGMRQVRFGAHETQGQLHTHFEAYDKPYFNGGRVVENSIIKIVP